MLSPFSSLSEGARRLIIVVSIAWLLAGLVVWWDELFFLWQGLWATSESTCRGILGSGNWRLTHCEHATAQGLDLYDRLFKNKSGAFNPYYAAAVEPKVLAFWLGGPMAFVSAALAAGWIKQGYKSK